MQPPVPLGAHFAGINLVPAAQAGVLDPTVLGWQSPTPHHTCNHKQRQGRKKVNTSLRKQQVDGAQQVARTSGVLHSVLVVMVAHRIDPNQLPELERAQLPELLKGTQGSALLHSPKHACAGHCDFTEPSSAGGGSVMACDNRADYARVVGRCRKHTCMCIHI